MKFKEWVIDLFKDERGSTSMKPVIGLFLALCLGTALVVTSVSKLQIKPSDTLVQWVAITLISMVAGDTLDKFSKKS
jgi:hypothetical protein